LEDSERWSRVLFVAAIGGPVSALPRPDLPSGAHRDLVAALHDLHHRAGWPSLRTLAGETGVSHTTVSKVFSAPILPRWGTLELLVEAMDGDTTAFHALWLSASAPAGHATHPEPRIAGRRTELAAVHRHLEAGNGLLLVTGEAGMGKTALVESASADVDCFVARGHCLPLSTEVPMLPIVDALRSLLDSDDGRWLNEAVAGCPGYVGSALAELLPELAAAAEPIRQRDTTGRQRLFVSIASLLRSLASSHPLGLLVEDLHWADTGTLDLLEHLLTTPQRLAVVGTWRVEDVTTDAGHVEWFARMTRLSKVRQLELLPLSEGETREQLSLLGVDLRDDLATRVHRRTRGQPLFTEQLAAHLEDDAPLPRLLRDLLDQRFAGISQAAWSITRALGVADRSLTADVLVAVTGLPHERLVGELHELHGRRLVRTTRLGAAELAHPLLAEATRRRLVAGEARQVHRALAEVLGAEPDASPAEVATHWEGAAEPDREIAWRVAAARSSAERYAVAGEAEQWLRALQVWPSDRATAGTPPVTRAEAYLAAMDALRVSLQFDRAAQMSDESGDRLGAVDPLTRAHLLRRAADYRGQREGPEVGLAVIEEAIAAYEALPVDVGMVHALLRKEALLLATGRYVEAGDVVRLAARVGEQVGDARAQRTALSWVAWHEGVEGFQEQAMGTMRRAASLVPAGSDPEGDIRQAVLLTDVLLQAGSSADDVELAGRPALEVAGRWEIESYHVLLVRSNVVRARIRQGRVAEAASLVDLASEGPVDIDRWPLYLDRAMLDCLRGHVDLARARATSLMDGFGDRVVGDDLEFLSDVATVHLWSGEPDKAVAMLLPALDAMVEGTPANLTRPALLVAARAAAEATAPESPLGRHYRDTLVTLAARLPTDQGERERGDRRLPAAYARALSAQWTAEIARLSGAGTVALWVASGDAWDALSRPHDAAYCWWQAAQVALQEGQGTVATKLLKRAARDAREHVPLLDAITKTAAGIAQESLNSHE
jgi:hypothetical protein